jgi:hypothetical protein
VGQRSRKYLLWSIFVGGALLLLGGGGALVSWRFSLGSLDLDAARSRWATRPFSHYRMDLT